jgi:hypothetical protein
MKISFLVLAIGLFGAFASQASDEVCKQRVESSKQTLAKTKEDYSQGKATDLDLVNAKLVLTEAMYDCTPFVKYHYCKYRQDLLNTKISIISEDDGSDSPALNPVKQELKATIKYCLDPKKQKGSPR